MAEEYKITCKKLNINSEIKTLEISVEYKTLCTFV